MITRKEFASYLAEQSLSHAERAVALLFYYRESQEFDERSASDLAADLHDLDFPKANATRLKEGLGKSKFTSTGSKRGLYKIDVRKLTELETLYGSALLRKQVKVSKYVIPPEWVNGTRRYLEHMVYQINAGYEYGMYDASAVLLRRLMESLIIEIYIKEKRTLDIQKNSAFFMLEKLIATVSSDVAINLSRNSPKTMKEIKQLGDTAAHDRTYVTPVEDIDDIKARARRLIQELLVKSGITT